MVMRPEVTYTPYATSSNEQTGNVITFTQFEEWNIRLPYSEAMVMRPAVTYTQYVTYPKEQSGNVITFTQFEEVNIITKTRNDAESGDKSDN